MASPKIALWHHAPDPGASLRAMNLSATPPENGFLQTGEPHESP